MKKSRLKRNVTKVLLIMIKPFIIPIILITILILLITSITDILYIAFNNEDKINLQKELKYYDSEKEYEKEEMKGFFSSVWDFVAKIFGKGEMSEYTDWPVQRTLYNNKLLWK